jgi:phospholipid transport system transporter-binding protein
LTVSEFVFEERGNGKFAVEGELSFDTANTILRSSENRLAQHSDLEIDLSGVERTDSAGLALLLEWKAQAEARKASIKFVGLPENLLAIARTTEVVDLI